jgi:hypothetical protein
MRGRKPRPLQKEDIMRLSHRSLAAGVAGALILATGGVGAGQERFRQVITVHGIMAGGASGVHQLTFSGPVSLPGVTLAPGSYLFRRLGANVLQVASARNHRPYAMLLTTPTMRTTPLDRYEIVLGEPLADGAPQKIEAWFAPGETVGQELTYR